MAFSGFEDGQKEVSGKVVRKKELAESKKINQSKIILFKSVGDYIERFNAVKKDCFQRIFFSS